MTEDQVGFAVLSSLIAVISGIVFLFTAAEMTFFPVIERRNQYSKISTFQVTLNAQLIAFGFLSIMTGIALSICGYKIPFQLISSIFILNSLLGFAIYAPIRLANRLKQYADSQDHNTEPMSYVSVVTYLSLFWIVDLTILSLKKVWKVLRNILSTCFNFFYSINSQNRKGFSMKINLEGSIASRVALGIIFAFTSLVVIGKMNSGETEKTTSKVKVVSKSTPTNTSTSKPIELDLPLILEEPTSKPTSRMIKVKNVVLEVPTSRPVQKPTSQPTSKPEISTYFNMFPTTIPD